MSEALKSKVRVRGYCRRDVKRSALLPILGLSFTLRPVNEYSPKVREYLSLLRIGTVSCEIARAARQIGPSKALAITIASKQADRGGLA